MIFSSITFALLLFINQQIETPKIALPILVIASIPILHYMVGKVFFLQDSILPSLFILATWLALSLGFTLTQSKFIHKPPKDGVMLFFSYTILVAGFISCIIAIIQWLHLGLHTRLILHLVSDRPYANLGQPNLFATLLIMSIISTLYLYEKKQLKTYLLTILAIIFIFTLSLTLSRTGFLATIFALIFFLLKAKTCHFRLKRRYMLTWFTFFILCTLALPYLNQLIANYIAHTPNFQMRSMSERTGNGFERFAMWNQIFQATLQQPWTGYGWYQTSVAQYAVAGQYNVHVWLTSAHNIIIDLFAWNGFILGSIIVLYFAYLLTILFTKTKTVTASCAFVIIISILIHALLEYPLYYAYYLIPLGLLSGIILAQDNQAQNKIKLFMNFPKIGLVIAVSFIALAIYHYARDNDTTPQKWSLFDKLDTRTQWVKLKNNTQLEPMQIEKYRHIVQCNVTHYDLYKFAQILLANGYVGEALQVIDKVNLMYGKHYSYADVLYSIDNTKKKYKSKT